MKPGAPTYAGVSDVLVKNINIYADERLLDMGSKSLAKINVNKNENKTISNVDQKWYYMEQLVPV
jgi:hypothetical protein